MFGLDATGGEVRVLLPGCTYEGAGGKIAANRKFLLEAFDAGFREFQFVDGMSPLVSRTDTGRTHVLMPVRIDGVTDVSIAQEPAPEAQEVQSADSQEKDSKAITTKEVNVEKDKKEVQDNPAEKLVEAIETLKVKLRDAIAATNEIAVLFKESQRAGKDQARELESARSALERIKSIKL